MTTESQTDQQRAKGLIKLFLISGVEQRMWTLLADHLRQSRAEGVESQEETIQRLRGSLQNCVNHLNRKRRYGEQEYDECIDQANRVLYETLTGRRQ